jgi:hypothetical protein
MTRFARSQQVKPAIFKAFAIVSLLGVFALLALRVVGCGYYLRVWRVAGKGLEYDAGTMLDPELRLRVAFGDDSNDKTAYGLQEILGISWFYGGPFRGKPALVILQMTYWSAIAPLILGALTCWRILLRFRKKARGSLCAKCGYDLRAHKPGQKCPECGTEIPRFGWRKSSLRNGNEMRKDSHHTPPP